LRFRPSIPLHSRKEMQIHASTRGRDRIRCQRPQTRQLDAVRSEAPRRRPAPSFATARVNDGKVAITHVLSVEIRAAHAFSLAGRLSWASAERFRSEVIVHGNGIAEVQITATDLSAELIKALLAALRDFLVEEELERASVHIDGREYVLST
jgi:hypothetical protein